MSDPKRPVSVVGLPSLLDQFDFSALVIAFGLYAKKLLTVVES
jgi:hypothetical protein